MKTITLLGSTGSIGTQTLDVVRLAKDKLRVYALTANSQIELLEQQIREFSPQIAVLMEEKAARELRERVKDLPVRVLQGIEGLIEASVAEQVQMVVTAVSGSIGLKPTLAALKAGKDIALANKETLVAAGELIINTAQVYNCSILPVDSEHSAIFQCLEASPHTPPKKIILTASGGPFRGWTKEQRKGITPEMALKHPSWMMGAKITIDSATMMNKGLEVIEAKFLFDLEYDQIEVLIHPQSIVHSMVEYSDGSVIAQLAQPDMRLPIQYALSYPDRWASPAVESLSFPGKTLSFEQPDYEAFPALALAYECGRRGGTLPAVMNAANEIAVHAFLGGRIEYHEIYEIVDRTCLKHQTEEANSLEKILAADYWARKTAEELISKKRNR
ncbi:MAG: 1-deoxy-D-xylulose-5-phosphate reductoisomerase [Desulfitobacteriia bacterium]